MTDKADNASSKIWEKLLAGVRSAVELRVVTHVGEVTVSGELDDPTVSFSGKQGQAIATSINLAEGDITSVVPESFWTPDKEIIREYHQQQVEQGKAIVERNLRLIGEIGESLARSLTELQKLEG